MSARKRVRAYLARYPEVYPPATFPGIISSLAESNGNPDKRVSLTTSDLRAVLDTERSARKAAARAIHEKLLLQRKNATYVQRLKDWDALSPVTLSRWKELQNTAAVQFQKAAEAVEKYRAAQAEAVRRGAEVDQLQEQNASLRTAAANAGKDEELYPNTIRSLQTRVAELTKENTDLRDTVADPAEQSSLARAEHRIRTQALAIEALSTGKRAAEQTVRDMADQLLALPTPGQYAQLKKTLSDCQQELQSLPTREMIDAASKATRYLRGENLRLREALDAASAEAKNQRAEKVTAQRGWAEVRKELDTLRAAPGTVNYHALWEREIKNRERAEEELSRAKQALANLREAVRKGTPPPFVSAPGGLSAEDLARVAQDLLPQFLATFLPRPKDKL